MRLWVALLAGLVFAALLILDPVALGQLGYACAVGRCGVRPRWIAIGLAVFVAVLIGDHLVRTRRRRPPPPVIAPVRRSKPRAPRAKATSPRRRTPSRRKADA